MLQTTVLLTEAVINLRKPSALAEQGRGIAMLRCGGTHSVKWLRVYRATRFNSVRPKKKKVGEYIYPQPHLSVRAAAVSGDVDPSSIGKSSLVAHYH